MAIIDVGKRVTELREARGLSINRLADLTGVAQSSIYKIENHMQNPTIDTIAMLCNELHVSLPEFFQEDTSTDDLVHSIRALSQKQKVALTAFLNTLNVEELSAGTKQK